MLLLTIFLIGFGMTIIGFINMIFYLNYLSVGLSFMDYLHLVVTRFECLIGVIGLMMISLIIFKGR